MNQETFNEKIIAMLEQNNQNTLLVIQGMLENQKAIVEKLSMLHQLLDLRTGHGK
jgi:hypothetical protein